MKPRELTYRTQPEDPRYFRDMVQRLVGRVVVVRSKGGRWMRCKLISAEGTPGMDNFIVSRKGHNYKLSGLWRIHNQGLFTEGENPAPRGKPKPVKLGLSSSSEGSRVPSSNNKPQGGKSRMATAAKSKSKTKAASNGRAPSLTVAQLKQAAKLKLGGSTWNEVREELGVSTSSGRFHELWAENGINAPEVRERATPGSAKPKAKTTTKAKAKPAAKAGKAKAGKVVIRGKGKAKANPS